MTTPTNGEVLKAINACLETRWIPAVENGGYLLDDAPHCQLCDLFLSRTRYESCEGCPLDIINDNCGARNSSFNNWMDESSPETAQAVVDALLTVRKKFFGE